MNSKTEIWLTTGYQLSSVGLFLGVTVSILGMTIFALYLLWLTFKTKGDMKAVLIGNRS